MPGGLMNLISVGASNLILTGNPKKTFFKATYNRYTNFGMQRFRLDYRGQRKLHYDQDTEMIFKIPRYADMAFDTYAVVDIPNIWSPLFFDTDLSGNWGPFEFRWIDNLGAQMIRSIKVFSGGTTLAEYPGEWLLCMTERDFNDSKKGLWDKMVGNVPELNNPAAALSQHTHLHLVPGLDTDINNRVYPNVINDGSCNNFEPSIRQRKLYIPLDSWFCGSSKTALPLVSVQYQEIFIKITWRPICDLFRIRDITDPANNFPYISPKRHLQFNNIWRFLNPPQNNIPDASQNLYPIQINDWDADIHLIMNYIFLGKEERRLFAQQQQKYLIKETHTYDFLNATGSTIAEMKNFNMISNYMWRFRRSDANLRNEWSNYTNWAYDGILPVPPDNSGAIVGVVGQIPSDIFYYTCLHNENVKDILLELGIIMDGNYREDLHPAGVYNFIEKYIRTTGNGKDGLYCYNFCLDSNQRVYQPSGAMNVNKYKKIQFEFTTITPPLNPNSSFDVICDPSGEIIGVRKEIWRQFNYNYDLRIFEERYNVIIIEGGQIGIMNAW